MTAIQDCSFGMKVESTYGTAVTVDRWYEFEGTVDVTYDKNIVQGSGVRVGRKAPRADRRVPTTTQSAIKVTVPVLSKGFGYLLTACTGSGVSTLVSASTYQQLFKFGTPGSYTIQIGVVRADGTTVDPMTFAGCVATEWELSLDNAGKLMLSVTFDGRSLATATAYTAPTYTASQTVYHFGEAAAGAMTVGGSLVVPTTTVLASGGTAVTNVRDFKLSWKRSVATDRFNLGGAGLKSAPVFGVATPTGSITYEYDSTTNRDAHIADTALALSLTLTSPVALSTGFEQFQVAIPAAKLDGGGLPDATGDLIVVSQDFSVLDDGTNDPVYLALRTSDSAL